MGDNVPSEGGELHLWQKRRYHVAFMGFMGFFSSYLIRVNTSIAIVAMTHDRITKSSNGTEISSGPEFQWSNDLKGHILSGFFYGYLCTMFLGGILAPKIGGKTLFGIGVAVSAVLSIITPLLVHIHVYCLLAVRILQGMCQGVTYPCIHHVWSKWAPPLERSRLATSAFSGCFWGTVVGMPASALISDHLGWPVIFYITGGFGLIWYICWIFLISGSPEKDSRIKPEELEYLQNTIKATAALSLAQVPWKSIFTSMHVWAVVSTHTCENWGFYNLLTQLPTYLNDIHNYKLQGSGFLSALPYLLLAILTQVAGPLSDWFLVKKILTVTQARKIFNCGGFLLQAGFMVGAGLWIHPYGSIAFLSLSIGMGAFCWAAFSVNHLDLAPQYASILMGITNTFGTMPGVLSTTFTGYMVHDPPTVGQWQLVFFVACGVYVFGAIFYLLFGSGERQPWAL